MLHYRFRLRATIVGANHARSEQRHSEAFADVDGGIAKPSPWVPDMGAAGIALANQAAQRLRAGAATLFIVAAVLAVILVFVIGDQETADDPAPPPESVAQWRDAGEVERIATAADWVARWNAGPREGAALGVTAAELVRCVDRVAALGASFNASLHQTATVCLVALEVRP